MIRAYAVSSVREAEAAAMTGLGEDELMSRAASALAAVASARLGSPGGRRVVALVGAGNNGGDALYAVALRAREGAAAVVIRVAESAHEGGLLAAADAGAAVLNTVGAHADPPSEVSATLGRAELVLDGIVGIGGRPGLSPEIDELLRDVSDTAYVLAVDLPSGADPTFRPLPGAIDVLPMVALGAGRREALDALVAQGAETVIVVDEAGRAIGSLDMVEISNVMHKPR